MIEWVSFQRWLRVAEEGTTLTDDEIEALYGWFIDGCDPRDAIAAIKRQKESGRMLGSW